MVDSRVVKFEREGGPEVLQVQRVNVADPRPGQVRVRVEAIGLNRAEAMYRGGYYYERPEQFPAVLGYEAAGVVDALGADVVGWAPGDEVSIVPSFSQREIGAYAQHVNVPARALVRRPEGQPADQGAAIWMAAATAYGGLIEIGKLRAGDNVLITAASGSVGLAAIQVAQRAGATAIVTTRKAAKREHLLRAGATHVIVTGEEPLLERVREYTDGRGAELVFDATAGASTTELASATARDGKLILYGFLHQSTEPGSFGSTHVTLPMTNWSIDMRWFAAGLELAHDDALLRRTQHYVLSGLRTGSLTSRIDRHFDLDEIVAAHRYLESNAQVGKVIVRVP